MTILTIFLHEIKNTEKFAKIQFHDFMTEIASLKNEKFVKIQFDHCFKNKFNQFLTENSKLQKAFLNIQFDDIFAENFYMSKFKIVKIQFDEFFILR